MLDDVLLVVIDEQGGHGQGDDHAEDAEQRTPDGERQQDDGGVKTGDVTHDLRREEGVLDNLHHSKDHQGHEKDEPEVITGIGSLDDSEDNGGDESHQLEIGHHIEQSDEHAEGDGQREVDDEETDAKEDTHAEGHQGLTAEVLVHTLLDVGHQYSYKRSGGYGLLVWHGGRRAPFHHGRLLEVGSL